MHRAEDYKFPFGTPLVPAAAKPPSKKVKAFVVGVYSSAVHARWISDQGRTLCKALAVASEPYSFWDGTGAAELVAAANQGVPRGAGSLVPADGAFNGPSGLVLDRLFLAPLDLRRSDTWITDLHDFYYLSEGNEAALARHYAPLVKEGLVRAASLPKRPASVAPSKAGLERLQDEFERASAPLVVTLGNEPIPHIFGKGAKKLAINGYGQTFDAVVFGRPVNGLKLCHPRQAGKLGRASKAWFEVHRDWVAGRSKA